MNRYKYLHDTILSSLCTQSELADQAAPFSLLHAAAITGNQAGLAKLAASGLVDIDLSDRFGTTQHLFLDNKDKNIC